MRRPDRVRGVRVRAGSGGSGHPFPARRFPGIALKALAGMVLMLVAWPLAGCAPNIVTYYRPAVEGGTIVTPRCVPTESVVEFDLPGAGGPVHARAWANNGRYVNQIDLLFTGKRWKELHFTSTRFQIHDLDKDLFFDASSVLALRPDGLPKLTAEPYRAPPERPGLFRFGVQINSSAPLPDRFELIVPPVVIDGEESAFPTIRFEQKQWLGVSPLNC